MYIVIRGPNLKFHSDHLLDRLELAIFNSQQVFLRGVGIPNFVTFLLGKIEEQLPQKSVH